MNMSQDIRKDENLILLLLDLESTGFSTKKDRIVQLGAALWNPSQLQPSSTFNCLVNPDGVSIHKMATKITGITNEMVSDKPSFSVIAAKFLTWTQQHSCNYKKLIVVAHNGIRFDFQMLRNEFCRARVSWNDVQLPSLFFFDSLIHFRALRKKGLLQSTSFSLENLHLQLIGHKYEAMHDALSDVLALGRIVLHPLALITWDVPFLSWEELRVGKKQTLTAFPKSLCSYKSLTQETERKDRDSEESFESKKLQHEIEDIFNVTKYLPKSKTIEKNKRQKVQDKENDLDTQTKEKPVRVKNWECMLNSFRYVPNRAASS
jgi:DNA polymerase III epsilon subunit-like protein